MTSQDAFDRCAGWLQAALDHAGNTHTLDDVREMIADGRARFWPFPRCVVVTEFIEYPQGKALNIWLVGGDDLAALLRMLPAFERWAKESGCRWTEGTGREEWVRVIGKGSTGYRAVSRLVKELGE